MWWQPWSGICVTVLWRRKHCWVRGSGDSWKRGRPGTQDWWEYLVILERVGNYLSRCSRVGTKIDDPHRSWWYSRCPLCSAGDGATASGETDQSAGTVNSKCVHVCMYVDEPDCGNFIHVSYVNMPLWPSRLVRLGSSAKQHSDPGMLVIVQRTLHMQLHIQCCVMHNAYYFMLFLYAVVLGQKWSIFVVWTHSLEEKHTYKNTVQGRI